MNMKKINVVLIGVGHDHAPAVYSSVMKQEIFDVVGFAVLESERTVFHDRIESYKKYIRYFTVEEALNCSGLDAAIIETEEEYLTKYSIMAIEKGLSVHEGGLQHSVIRSTTYQEAQKLNWWNSAEKTDSEMFSRYDNMMRGFAEKVMEKNT